MSAEPTFDLDDEMLSELAYLRASGRSWEAAGAELRVPPQALRRAARSHPSYRALARDAAEEVEAEAGAELVASLREQLRAPEPAVAQTAAQTLAQHLADTARERTRLKVERLRFAVARERLDVQRERQNPNARPADPPPAPAFGPDDVPNRPDVEPRMASRAHEQRATVWLWSGQHPLGGVEPDATDTPLALFEDHTIIGRHVFWAVRAGAGRCDHGAPVPELTPDQVQQLGAVGGRQSNG